MVRTRGQTQNGNNGTQDKTSFKAQSNKPDQKQLLDKFQKVQSAAAADPEVARKANAQVKVREKNDEQLPQGVAGVNNHSDPNHESSPDESIRQDMHSSEPNLEKSTGLGTQEPGKSSSRGQVQDKSNGNEGSAAELSSNEPRPSNESTSTAAAKPRNVSDDPEDVVVPHKLIDSSSGVVEGYFKAGYGRYAVCKHGPIGASQYVLEKRKSANSLIENDTPDLREFSLAHMKAARQKEIIALQGVVWNGKAADDFESLKPPTQPNKRGVFTRVKCKWLIDGREVKSWETRATVNKFYPVTVVEDNDYRYNNKLILEKGSGMEPANKAIILCAIRGAERYEDYRKNPNAWADKKDRSPSVDPNVTSIKTESTDGMEVDPLFE